MRKRYIGFIRLFVALSMVLALTGVLAMPASALTTRTLDVSFDETWYQAGDTITVTFDGGGTNQLEYQAEWIHVAVLSETGDDIKTAYIEETGVDEDRWEYSLTLVSETSEAGELEVATTDTLWALFDDPPGEVATTLFADEAAGQTVLSVTEADNFTVGDWVRIGVVGGATTEYREITAKDDTADTITVAALAEDHSSGEEVQSVASGTAGVDDEDPSSTLADINPYLNADDIVGDLYEVQVDSATDTADGSGILKIEVIINGTSSIVYYDSDASETTVTNRELIWSVPGDGEYTIISKATDLMGNVEDDPADLTTEDGNLEIVVVDTTAPSVTAAYAQREETGTADLNIVDENLEANLYAEVTDALSGIGVETGSVVWADLDGDGSLDSATESMIAETDEVDELGRGLYRLNNVSAADVANVTTDGTSTVEVYVIDNALNESDPLELTIVWVEDTTDPTIVSTSVTYAAGVQAVPGETGDTTITVEATDDVSGVTSVTLDTDDAEAVFGSGNTPTLTETDGVWSGGNPVDAATDAGTYTIEFTVEDNAGNTETGTVTIEVVTERTTYRVALEEGWNFISLPRTPEDPSLAAALADSPITEIHTASGGVWSGAELVDGTWTGTLTQIVAGLGYWVLASEDGTLTETFAALEPLEAPPAIDLPTGWSTIGFASLTLEPDMPVEAYLSSIAGDWAALYSPDDNWAWAKPTVASSAFPGDPADTTDIADKILEAGKAYWIFMTDAATLAP